MYNWLLQTLSDVLNDCEDRMIDNTKVLPENRSTAELKAQREWFSAIASAENLLEFSINNSEKNEKTPQGLVFSSPVPVFNNTALISHLQTGIFTPEAFQFKALMPSSDKSQCHHTKLLDRFSLGQLPLIPNDPIAQERFCLIFTEAFALVLVLGTDRSGTPQFHFSFAPETIERVWQTLRSRLMLVNYQDLSRIDSLVADFETQCPDYRLVSRFSRQLLQNLPDTTSLALEKTRNIDTAASNSHSTIVGNASSNNGELERELLQALTHEVRTPLTTIRTLTKLLLKKKQELQPKVIQRLQAIDRECTEQIERMELIFRAAELEATPVSQKSVNLTPCCLESVLQQTIPRWEEQAQRRKVNLDVSVPQHLPEVVSDPAMLDRVLTGLIESCTRSLSTGDKIRVHVSTAGDRLKLRVISQSDNSKNPFKSLGHLLMFQPGTGCLSLNWDVTKQMFQAMGGKLTVRQRARQEKELTIFLPLGKKVNNTR